MAFKATYPAARANTASTNNNTGSRRRRRKWRRRPRARSNT